MAGFLTNGLPMLGQIGPLMFVPVDTELPRGTNPQSVAASAFQVAAALGDCLNNHEEADGHEVSKHTLGGTVLTEELHTDPHEEYTFTLHNNLIDMTYLAHGTLPEVGIYSATNTGGVIPGYMYAIMVLHSTMPGLHRVDWTWRNMGETPLNGRMYILWHL